MGNGRIAPLTRMRGPRLAGLSSRLDREAPPNLGAMEILGMAANGAQYGLMTVHYYWIGAVPAMVFLGVVMMPFYYRSKVHSVPFMRRRFNGATQLFNASTFAVAQILISGIN